MNEFLTNLRSTWDKFSRNQKMGAGVVFVLVLASIGGLAAFYAREDYVPLFDYIRDRREALAVEARLRELGIPNMATENGHIIMVPATMKESAHLGLAEANALPNAVPSYSEILDQNQSFGLTEKELDVRINRAKEGHLARTIMLFRNIDHAQVHVDAAKDSVFIEDQKETRVSVLLTPNDPLTRISEDQVKTIVNLVANSISGLKKENIFITDDKGTDLLGLIREKDQKLDHLQLTLKKETELKKKAASALSEIYGEDNINVALTLELDFDRIEEEAKELAPPVDGEEQGVKISEEIRETESETMDPKAVPGTQTNIPGYQGPENTRQKSKSREQRTNYAYQSRTRSIERAVGLIKRLTVSVVINKDVLPEDALTDEARQGIIDMVASATGLDTVNRNDRISVVAFTFKRLQYERAQKHEVNARKFQSSLFATGVACALLSAVVFLIRYQMIEQKRRKEEMLRKAQEAIQEQSQEREDIMTLEQREKNERERFLLEVAREDPEQLVRIIRSMMFDETYY